MKDDNFFGNDDDLNERLRKLREKMDDLSKKMTDLFNNEVTNGTVTSYSVELYTDNKLTAKITASIDANTPDVAKIIREEPNGEKSVTDVPVKGRSLGRIVSDYINQDNDIPAPPSPPGKPGKGRNFDI